MSTSGQQPTKPATPPPPIEPNALRIVLFGMPDAGKSSLLGALGQAAQTQERQLQGRLSDPWHGLGELQRRLYDEKSRETLEEIVPYPVTFEPLHGGKPDPEERLDAVLFDCDGRAANEILTHRGSLDDAKAEKLSQAIRDADALVLVVDASATHEQMEADFGEFVRFLRLLEQNRSDRSEIGDFPVFLVLSKCDLLAKPTDLPSNWSESIEERRKQVETRFKDFLEGDDDAPTGFGSIDLSVLATAVRRPALHGEPAAPREPFGVADLFRQAFRSAADFRERHRRAHKRLLVTVAAAVAFVALMIAGAVTLVLTRDSFQSVPLAGIVENYRSRENPNPSARLTEPLQRKIGELSDMRRNEEFERLPAELKDYVSNRLKELTTYQEYKSRLERERPPSQMRGPEDLSQLETRLQDSLGPPSEYQNDWQKTDAALLRQKWLNDCKAIRNGVAEMTEWHGKNTEAAVDLMQFKDRPGSVLQWPEWHERVASLLATAAKPPHPEAEPLRGSEALPTMKAPAVTWFVVHSFRTVELAQGEWESHRQKLERLRDISLALGLGGDGSAEKSPLKIPDGFAIDQAPGRLQLLRKSYPDSGDWWLQNVSAAASPAVRSAARLSYDRLIDAGKSVVLRELKRLSPDGQETQERWKSAMRALADNPELREWGQLVKMLQRLDGDTSGDPVAVLTAFVQHPSFALKFDTIRLSIPDDIHDTRVRPNGKLIIVDRAGAVKEVAFRLGDDERRDNRLRVTSFAFSQEGNATLTYTPGAEFFATLPVRDGNGKEWKLTWLRCKSDLYRFECLYQSPRLHEKDDADPARNGKLVDVRLSLTPESGIPRVPDLMPVVILKP
jgi:GTPase SAR1 family protein